MPAAAVATPAHSIPRLVVVELGGLPRLLPRATSVTVTPVYSEGVVGLSIAWSGTVTAVTPNDDCFAAVWARLGVASTNVMVMADAGAAAVRAATVVAAAVRAVRKRIG